MRVKARRMSLWNTTMTRMMKYSMKLSSSHETVVRWKRSAAKNAAPTSTMPMTIWAARVPLMVSRIR